MPRPPRTGGASIRPWREFARDEGPARAPPYRRGPERVRTETLQGVVRVQVPCLAAVARAAVATLTGVTRYNVTLLVPRVAARTRRSAGTSNARYCATRATTR